MIDWNFHWLKFPLTSDKYHRKMIIRRSGRKRKRNGGSKKKKRRSRMRMRVSKRRKKVRSKECEAKCTREFFCLFLIALFLISIRPWSGGHTHIRGFCYRFYRGSILPDGSQCFAVGQNRAPVKSVTKRPLINVCKRKNGVSIFVIELFYIEEMRR